MRRFWQPRWQLGILSNSLADVVAGEELDVCWIENPYRDGWMADPFVLDVSDEAVELLVEDFRYADWKGRISKVTIERQTNRIIGRKVLLEGGHYSFPAILRVDGKTFVYPEQARQGRLELFEYDRKKECCQYVGTLSDEPFSDAVVSNGILYSTIQGLEDDHTLKAWRLSESFPRVMTRASRQNVERVYCFDECVARNAGDFFEVDGVTYRPAQECNRWYGNAVSIQRFEDGAFTEVRRIPGIHTLNSYKDVTVVDRKIFPFKWLYWLLRRSDL